MAVPEAAVRRVQSEESLFDFLRDELNWRLPEQASTYEFTAEELGLPEGGGKVGRVRQFAPSIGGQPWGIFIVEFTNGRFYRTGLRNVLRGLVPRRRRDSNLPAWDVPNLLFLCTSPDYQKFTVAHFDGDRHSRAKLSAFGWSPEEPIRTLCELNLPALKWPQNPTDTPAWLRQWSSAFDVEKVTDEFFKQYRRVFEHVEKAVRGVPEDRRRLFTQRLFNRLLFVRFLEKKGWLRLGSRLDYLRALYEAADGQGEDFYRDRLYWLFFHGLGTLLDQKEVHDREELRERRGDVPFLNGGLFEMQDADDVRGAAQIPNDAFGLILNELFGRYNFTVSESTPLDVEVAVDPEMLGKVFEGLVTERHESGSYYTPRSVVAFMCREALKGYLAGNWYSKRIEEVAAFVDGESEAAAALRDPEGVLEALKRVLVCDPACGSGAYLVGMMQELLRLRDSLFRANVRDHATVYHRKLEIIQRNLYGVDSDRFAANIAMLRLWLSLIVDDDRSPLDDLSVNVSLPNLRFKIQVGDSLTAPHPDPSALTLLKDEYSQDAERLRSLHDEYFAPSVSGTVMRSREAIESDIATKQAEIGKLLGTQAPAGSVDWQSAFAEVFAVKEPMTTFASGALNLGQALTEPARAGGFDIVIANPPYGITVRNHYSALVGHTDSYTAFMGLAHCLSVAGGVCSYIVPTSWETGERFVRFRRWFLGQNEVMSVVNLPYDVFDTPHVDTGIVTYRVGVSTLRSDHLRVATLPKREQEGLTNITAHLQELPVSAVTADKNLRLILSVGAAGLLSRLTAGTRLDSVARVKRGIAHYKYEMLSTGSDPSWYPFYEGAVHRYRAEPLQVHQWVRLKPRDLEWHSGARLVVRRLVSRANRLMAARLGFDAAVKESLLVLRPVVPDTSLTYILALLNSALWSYLYLTRSTAATKDDFRQVTLEGLHSLPLTPTSARQADIESLVQRVEYAAGRGEDFGDLDAELDDRIYDLYRIAPGERSEIEAFLGAHG